MANTGSITVNEMLVNSWLTICSLTVINGEATCLLMVEDDHSDSQ